MSRSMHVTAVVMWTLAATAAAREAAPAVLVDEGACPFECCRYGGWTAVAPVPAYAAPRPDARRAAPIAPGTRVTALSGHVRTRGQPFVVHRAHGDFRPGDRLIVYTYYGEGEFRVWHGGRQFTEDLGFSPYGGTAGPRCTEDPQCWGSLERGLESQWWAHVRQPDGRTAWVRAERGFEGQSACF